MAVLLQECPFVGRTLNVTTDQRYIISVKSENLVELTQSLKGCFQIKEKIYMGHSSQKYNKLFTRKIGHVSQLIINADYNCIIVSNLARISESVTISAKGVHLKGHTDSIKYSIKQ